MERVGSLGAALNIAAGALEAFSAGVGASAHNIANVSTDGFRPLRAGYVEGRPGVAARVLPESEGGIVGEIVDDAPSGADLAREFPRLIAGQRAFEANARVAGVADEMTGAILDIKG